MELYHITNDMDNQNKEIENLTKDYNNLINNCLAYKIIIEKMLDLNEDGNYVDGEEKTFTLKNREKCKSENNFNRKNVNSIDEKEEFGKNQKSKNSKIKSLKNKSLNNSYIITNSYNNNNNNSKNKSIFMSKNNFNEKENITKINALLNQKKDLNK